MLNNPLQGALQKMGSNFIVAAFVPAMAFVVFSLLAFEPILPPAIVKQLGGEFTQLGQSTFIALLFTIILGFTLFTLENYIYKSFEGYDFLLGIDSGLRRSFIRRQKRCGAKIENERKWIEQELKKIEQKIESETGHGESSWRARRLKRYEQRQERLKDRHYYLVTSYNENFPPLPLILPTRFGNILRAAELYPSRRYCIDAVPIWGRMAHVIPDPGMDKLDQANNQSLFLLNMSLMASIFTLLSLLASAYQALLCWAKLSNVRLLSFIPIDRDAVIYQERIGIYIVLAIFAGATACFFYGTSLLNVSQYGSMIKTAYDLYRFRLLESLHLPLPEDLIEERQRWRQISEFMAGGEAFGPINFIYQHPEK